MAGVRSNSLWTFKQHFYDLLRRTAEKEGLSEEEVFDLLVDGKLDLILGDEQSNPVA